MKAITPKQAKKSIASVSTIPQLPATGFVRLPLILAIFPVGRTTWLNGCKSGKYPKPVKLTERTVAWKVEDIKNLIESFNQGAAA